MISQKAFEIADACRFCWMCRHICPTGIASGREEYTPRARGLSVSMYKRGMPLDADIADAIFSCALCGACSNDCVTGYEPPVFIRQMRTEAVVQNLLPPAVAAVVDRALDGGDIVTKTADNTKLLAKLAALPAQADVAVVLGETACNRTPDNALCLLSLLDKAGVSYCVVREKSGGALYDLIGDVDEVRAQAAACAAAIEKTGAGTLVALDSTDARTFCQEYPAWEIALSAKPVTATAYVWSLVQDNKLKVSRADIGCATYQDPDHIVRDLDESEPARALLAAMQVPVCEMFLHGRLARSCGNEVLDSYQGALCTKMARIRLEDAVRTGADTLVTACPVCFDMLRRVADDRIRVRDLFCILDSVC